MNRNTHTLRTLLLEDAPLQDCRDQLELHGHNVRTAASSLIFVTPEQFPQVARLAEKRRDLTPSHIIFAASFRPQIQATLDEAKRRGVKGAWFKTPEELVDPSSSSASITGSSARESEVEGILEIINTFWTWSPLEPSAAVTESTTDSRKVKNPRRAAQ